jgi:hypothetical protein
MGFMAPSRFGCFGRPAIGSREGGRFKSEHPDVHAEVPLFRVFVIEQFCGKPNRRRASSQAPDPEQKPA